MSLTKSGRNRCLALVVTGLLLLTSFLTGCGSTGSTPTLSTAQGQNSGNANAKKITVGLLCPTLNAPVHVAINYGEKQRAKELGINVISYNAGTFSNIEKQISQFEDLIAQKVDVVIILPTNGTALCPVIDKARAAGIKVVDAGAQVTTDVDARYRSDDITIGQEQAKYMVQALGGKGKVAMFPGPAGVSWAVDRAKGFKDYIAKNSQIQIVAERWANNEEPQGLNNMQDILQTFPDLNGLFNGSDRLAVGASQAIKAANKVGKIVVTTADLAKDTEALVQDGVISIAVVQLGVTFGTDCMDLANKVAKGEKVPETTYAKMQNVTKDDIAKLDWNLVLAPSDYKP